MTGLYPMPEPTYKIKALEWRKREKGETISVIVEKQFTIHQFVIRKNKVAAKPFELSSNGRHIGDFGTKIEAKIEAQRIFNDMVIKFLDFYKMDIEEGCTDEITP